MDLEKLSHKKGPVYNNFFCPALVLQNWWLILENVLCVYSTMWSNFKKLIQIIMSVSNQLKLRKIVQYLRLMVRLFKLQHFIILCTYLTLTTSYLYNSDSYLK